MLSLRAALICYLSGYHYAARFTTNAYLGTRNGTKRKPAATLAAEPVNSVDRDQ